MRCWVSSMSRSRRAPDDREVEQAINRLQAAIRASTFFRRILIVERLPGCPCFAAAVVAPTGLT
jgi:hypothetical protein